MHSICPLRTSPPPSSYDSYSYDGSSRGAPPPPRPYPPPSGASGGYYSGVNTSPLRALRCRLHALATLVKAVAPTIPLALAALAADGTTPCNTTISSQCLQNCVRYLTCLGDTSDAELTAQLLGASGDLYFTVDWSGTGYLENATASLNGNSIGRGEAIAPVIQLLFDDSDGVTGVSVPCQPSDEECSLTPSLCAQRCALTTNYGRLGEFEFTQGRLMYGTWYEFAINAQRENGTWRG